MIKGLVSIIVPCYNGQRYLAQTLRSVLLQTYQHWECILIDDGSTDRSGEIFSACAMGDARFSYFRQENQGLAAARNAGIERCQGEFIQFLDADDILMARKLEEGILRLNAETDLGAVHTDYAYFKAPSQYFQMLPARFPAEDPLRCFLLYWDVSFLVPAHAFLFRQSVFENTRFDPSLGSSAEDVDSWIRIASHGVRFGYIDKVLVVYRITESSASSAGVAVLTNKIRIAEQYVANPAFATYADELAVVMQVQRQRLAMALFRDKEFRQGFRVMSMEWRNARWSARTKMVGWLLSMMVLSRDQVAEMRAWIVRNTGIRWGAWSTFRPWAPSESLRVLLEATEDK